MSNLFYLPRIHSQAGAKLYFRVSGTSTPQNVYTDIDLSVAHTNPVVADADGYFDPIYLDPSLPDYRMIHTDGSDDDDDYTLEVLLEPIRDDIPSSSNVASGFRVKGTAPEIIFEETDASTDNKVWRIRVQAETLTISTGDDAESSFTDRLSLSRSDYLRVSGSFTPTFTGLSAGAYTIYYERVGDSVCLHVPGGAGLVSGTGTATTFSFSGVPAVARPNANAQATLSFGMDANVGVKLAASVSNAGVVTFYNADGTGTPDSAGFTASGTRALGINNLGWGWCIYYSADQ